MRVTPQCDTINSFTISNAANVQNFPDIAFGSGLYAAVWSDERYGMYRIFGARITPDGTVLDPNGIVLGPSSSSYQYTPSVVHNGTNFFTVWGYYGVPGGISGRFMNPDGSVEDTVGIVSDCGIVINTRLAWSGYNYMTAWLEWSNYNYQLMGQMIMPDGSPVGQPFLIAASVETSNSHGLIFDGYNYVVVYCPYPGVSVMGRKYDINGAPLGDLFQVTPTTTNCSNSVIAAGDEYYLNVWSENGGATNSDIMGNIDIPIFKIEEKNSDIIGNKNSGAMIIAGPIQKYFDRDCKIYNITGQEVDAAHLAPGIYFVKTEDKLLQKVVKLR